MNEYQSLRFLYLVMIIFCSLKPVKIQSKTENNFCKKFNLKRSTCVIKNWNKKMHLLFKSILGAHLPDGIYIKIWLKS